MPSPKQFDVLIVCVLEDEPLAKAFADMFERAGLQVGGAPSAPEDMRSCGAALVVWSQASIRSRAFLDAAQRAVNAGKAVVACLIAPPPAASINHAPAFDLTHWAGDPDDPSLDRLFFAVDRMVNSARAAVEGDLGRSPSTPETRKQDHAVPPDSRAHKHDAERTADQRAAARRAETEPNKPPPRSPPPHRSTPAPNWRDSDPMAAEAQNWAAIRHSRNPEDFLKHLADFGAEGAFAELAQMKLAELEVERRAAKERAAEHAEAERRAANERAAAERAEAERRAANERAAAERAEAERRAANERAAAERAEAKRRAAKERAAAERVEAERRAAAEHDNLGGSNAAEQARVDVFISYPRAARRRVEPIKQKLQRLGLEVFFDVDDIDGGAEFPTVIDKAVKSAKVVLGCWSAQAFTRPWVMQECRVGKARGILVPVAIDVFADLEVPTDFFGINYLNLVDWSGSDTHDGWNRTLRALERHLNRPLSKQAQRAQP